MIKAVIFDWGGVIAPNPKGGWLGVLAEMLDSTIENLLPHWQTAGYKELSKGAIGEEEFFERLEVSYGAALPEDVSKIWIEGSAFDPWPEILAFIQELKLGGIKVALLSNTVSAMSSAALEKGLYEGFGPLILSDAVGLVKPELPIYQKALDELDLPANECIYVDDLPKNLEPARQLGMAIVLASDDVRETVASIRGLL